MDTTLSYADAESVQSWAEDAALYCQSTGIISGQMGGMFATTGDGDAGAETAGNDERFIESLWIKAKKILDKISLCCLSAETAIDTRRFFKKKSKYTSLYVLKRSRVFK
jgi:hypothetical protein